MRPGDRVETGASGDRLGEIQRAERRCRQDGYWITPLSLTPGDGYLPSWYPAHMVRPWQPVRWAYDATGNRWVRTHARPR